MLHRHSHVGLSAIVAAALCIGGQAQASEFSARLDGFQEVGGLGAGQTGAILSKGTGKLSLDVHKNAISYKLKYSGLGSAVTQVHVHFGREHVGGGIIAFFCTNLGNGPAATPACPETGGTVTGTLTAASVVGPAAQNVAVGDFAALVTALDADTAYVNVHTSQFASGEIRGQIRKGEHDDD